ncbi:hypothetical protein [Aquimarina litoralis]|uniref:hypothetical protein n=1 Tax=Aquimarina litoralis TaxID=584605 RepID=UPI001C58ED23|nr:hypothetical protein [Aquimarina litoralis]MBW1295771.1 hypothetical protein [Aquimarina litoralis]
MSSFFILFSEKYAPYFLAFVFFVLSFIGITHHELWLDESHHWLLARDSISITDLITNTKYEGHPILWNIALFYITRFSANPFWMQFLHIILSTIVVFVFLKKAPFSQVFKILFIFGYFIFFEYNIISRNYGFGVLLIFCALGIFQSRYEKFILFATLLAFANHAHAIFIILTCSLLGIIFLEMIQQKQTFLKRKFLIGISIFTGITLLSIIQIIPPSDTIFFERVNEFSIVEKLSKSGITFFKGIFLVPDFRILHFWNTHFMVNLSKPLAMVLGVISISIPCFLFFKNKLVLVYVYLGILGSIIFFFVTQLSAPRYFGIHFLFIITGLWIDNYYPLNANILNTKFPLSLLKKIKQNLVYGILIIQMIAGITAFSFDIFLPFSNSKQTVAYLNASNLTHKTIVVQGCGGTPLSSYLEKSIFFLDSNSYQSYCVWNRKVPLEQNPKAALNDSLERMLKSVDQSVIFISTHFLNIEEYQTITNSLEYKFLNSFDSSIVQQESYYIYEISKI